MSEELAAAVEQEAAENQAAIRAVEERVPAPEAEAEREPTRDAHGRFVADADPKPNPDNFDDWDTMAEAQSRWAARQELGKQSRDQVLSNRVAKETYATRLLREQALAAGLIEPSDDMDTKTWRSAFEAKMAKADGTAPPPLDLAGIPPADSEPESEPDQDSGADQQLLDGYHQRAQAFTELHPDFPDVIANLELPPHVAPAVELAILGEECGPQLAYELAKNPQLIHDLDSLTPAQAAARIGRVGAYLDWRNDFLSETQHAALGQEIPSYAMDAFARKNRALHEADPLSEEELELAKSLQLQPHVTKMLVAMNAPEIARWLVRNPSHLARINHQHPLAVAGEFAKIQSELDREAASRPEKRLPAPVTPTRKTSATDSALSDNLSPEIWAKRFRRKMGYDAG